MGDLKLYHVLAYGNVSFGNTANSALPAVSDQIFAFGPSGNPLPPKDLKLLLALGLGASLQRARMVQPKTRQLQGYYLRPLEQNANVTTNPNVDKSWVQPPSIQALEEITVEATNTANATATNVFLAVGDGIDPIPPGYPYRLRATSTTTATAQAWTLLSYTLEQQLPAGRYAVIGIEVISTSCFFSRMIFDNTWFRPGLPGQTTNGKRSLDAAYEYQLGVLGYFLQTSLPRIEVFCGAGDTSFEIYLHVLKTN